MLLCLIAHLFINKLRMEYSCKIQSPGPAPHIDEPVPLDDYLDAAMDMLSNQEIDHPNISAVPTRPQQVMTIGLIRMLLEATFVKLGKVLEDVNYHLRTAAQAYDSHTKSVMQVAFSKYSGPVPVAGQEF
jgi:hypothetical protein